MLESRADITSALPRFNASILQHASRPMNTICLLLTGHTTPLDLTLGPLLLHKLQSNNNAMSTTTITRTPTDLKRFSSRQSTPSTPTLSRASSTSSTSTIRPTSSHKRSRSKDNLSWYTPSENPTLEDFAERLNSLEKRVERFVSQCATNIVMALLRPTPMVLFFLNPVTLIAVIFMVIIWLTLIGSGK